MSNKRETKESIGLPAGYQIKDARDERICSTCAFFKPESRWCTYWDAPVVATGYCERWTPVSDDSSDDGDATGPDTQCKCRFTGIFDEYHSFRDINGDGLLQDDEPIGPIGMYNSPVPTFETCVLEENGTCQNASCVYIGNQECECNCLDEVDIPDDYYIDPPGDGTSIPMDCQTVCESDRDCRFPSVCIDNCCSTIISPEEIDSSFTGEQQQQVKGVNFTVHSNRESILITIQSTIGKISGFQFQFVDQQFEITQEDVISNSMDLNRLSSDFKFKTHNGITEWVIKKGYDGLVMGFPKIDTSEENIYSSYESQRISNLTISIPKSQFNDGYGIGNIHMNDSGLPKIKNVKSFWYTGNLVRNSYITYYTPNKTGNNIRPTVDDCNDLIHAECPKGEAWGLFRGKCQCYNIQKNPSTVRSNVSSINKKRQKNQPVIDNNVNNVRINKRKGNVETYRGKGR